MSCKSVRSVMIGPVPLHEVVSDAKRLGQAEAAFGYLVSVCRFCGVKRENPPFERRLDGCDFSGSEIARINDQNPRRRQGGKQCCPGRRGKFLRAEQECFETS